ncbi:major facilitator superfamily transporter [compost metagenome]
MTPVYARQLTSDLGWVALAVSAYSVTNLAGNLFAGFLIDRIPKGLAIALGLALGGLALALASSATGVGGLIAGLMLNGAALSVVTPAAFALLSQALPESSKAVGMARSGAAIGLAAMIGPPIGGLLADRLGYGPSYLAIGAFLASIALVCLLVLRKTSPVPPEPTGWGDFWGLVGDRALRRPYLGAFTLMFANGSLIFALPPYIHDLGLPNVLLGALFSTFALSAMVIFLSPLGALPKRLGAARTLAVGAGLLAVGIAAIASLTALPALFGALVVYGLGFGLVFPSAVTDLVAHVPEGKRGTAFGIFYAVFSLGAIVGPVVLARAPQLGIAPFHLAALVPAGLALGVWLRARVPRHA